MPIYEYRCPKCFREVEEFTHLSEADEPRYCAKCYDIWDGLKVQLKRIVSMPAPPQFGPGAPGTSSQLEWSARQKAKLEARSNDYDKSPAGRENIEKSVARMKKSGIM